MPTFFFPDPGFAKPPGPFAGALKDLLPLLPLSGRVRAISLRSAASITAVSSSSETAPPVSAAGIDSTPAHFLQRIFRPAKLSGAW